MILLLQLLEEIQKVLSENLFTVSYHPRSGLMISKITNKQLMPIPFGWASSFKNQKAIKNGNFLIAMPPRKCLTFLGHCKSKIAVFYLIADCFKV